MRTTLAENGSSKLLPFIAAVIGGVLLFLGYVGFDQFYLEWICLVPVLWAVRDQHPRRAFFIGWLAGIVAHTGGFYWVIGMFKAFAGLPWPVAVLGLLLLAAANGIVLAVWAWGVRLVTGATGWNVVLVAPVLWTAMEKVWPEIFPNYLGASQYLLPRLTQVADLTGILGVSFLVVLINAVIYQLAACWFQGRRIAWRELASVSLVLVSVLGYGEMRLREVGRQVASADTLTVGLVQTNRGAASKYLDPDASFLDYQMMSRTLIQARPLDLLVWPEGICEMRLPESRQGTIPALGELATPVLMGAVLEEHDDGKGRVSNTALLTDATGRVLGTYDKSVLVPFGEYIPLGDRFPSLYSWSPYSSRFWPGKSDEPLALGNHLLSVSICYEDIFPDKVRSLMRGGAAGRKPDAMFNLTNDSWYGNSTEPIEHLALASFRCIEERRALVRVTNTGISAIVDPAGRIVSRTGVWTRETLVHRVPMLKGSTVYARFGDWLGWLCVLLSALSIGHACRFLRSPGSEDAGKAAQPGPASTHRPRKGAQRR